MRYDIKVLSVNEAWKGRRFRSDSYKAYSKHLSMLLKPLKIAEQGKLSITYRFGFSSSGSDIDNPIKPIQDILGKKYGINDNRFYELHAYKEVVPKGNEFLELEIKEL